MKHSHCDAEATPIDVTNNKLRHSSRGFRKRILPRPNPTDSETKEMIRQIPSEDALSMAEHLEKDAGLFASVEA